MHAPIRGWWMLTWGIWPMSDTVLTVESLTAGYVPEMPILHDVDMHLDRGEIVSIIGPNGAGKTTLIKSIAGLLIIESGRIRAGEEDLIGIRPDEMTRFDIAYVPQTDNIFKSLTIKQNLLLAANRGDDPAAYIDKLFSMFADLRSKQSQKARQLSGGQRQMLAIAMALVAAPKIILMDEPTAGLSPKIAGEILELIVRIAKNDVSIILVEQNVRAAMNISDRTYVLAEGQNQVDGNSRELMKGKLIADIYLGGRRFKTS